jgi:hypothetical protein
MSHALLMQRRFGPLFLAQLFSAFNDNFLKNALVFLILYKLAGPNAEALIALAGGLFIAPFFLLSGLGASRAAFQAFAKSRGVAELMVPSEVMVARDIPLLGSGKLDFAGAKRLVEDRLAVSSAA